MSATFLSATGDVCLAHAGALWLPQMSSISSARAGWSVVVRDARRRISCNGDPNTLSNA
jgi:hypothetical protein